MKRWLIEHGVYVVLSLALSGAGVYFLLHLTRDADANSAALLVTQVKLDTALDKINAPCTAVKGKKLTASDDKPCGTLADINQTLRTIRGAAGQLEAAGQHENKNLDTLDKQEATLAQKLNGTVDAVKGLAQQGTTTLKTANTALGGIRPLLDKLTTDAGQLEPMETQATALIAEVRPAAAKLPAIAKHVNGMTDSGDKMLADAQEKERAILHPSKKKLGFWGAVGVGTLWFHSHIMPPIF